MPQIEVYTSYCKLRGFEDLVYKMLHSELSFKVKNAWFTPAYQKGHWDGHIRLFTKVNQSFKTGLLYRVCELLDSEEITYQVIDNRNLEETFKLKLLDSPLNLKGKKILLRPEQREAVEQYCNLTVKGHFFGRGLLHLPPGVGKTITLGMLGKVVNQFPLVFICQRVDLVHQTREVFKDLFGCHIGIVAEGEIDTKSPVVVCTIQSICKAFDLKIKKDSFEESEKVTHKQPIRDLIKSAKHIQLDEAHHTIAESYQDLIPRLETCNIISACSGTVKNDQGNELLMEQLCGPVYYSKSREYCVKKGYLVPVDMHFLELPSVSSVAQNYATISKVAVTENPLLVEVCANLVRALRKDNKSSVIMVNTISQGEQVSKMLKIPFLNGSVKGRERQKVYEQLQNKKILAIVSTVTDEGTDIPSLDCCIILALRKSQVRALQRLRCTRPYPGKDKGMVYILYTGNKYISQHATKLRNLYKKDSTISIKTHYYKKKK